MKLFLLFLVYNCLEKYIVLLPQRFSEKEIRGKMKRSISSRCGKLIADGDIEHCLALRE